MSGSKITSTLTKKNYASQGRRGLGQRGVSGCGGLMGKRRERRRWEDPAADKIAAARAMIQEADQRLHGIVTFLERTGMDRDDELVRRLANRARRERYWAEARAGRR